MCNRLHLFSFLLFFLLCVWSRATDWQAGDWRIDISGTGTPGTGNCPIYYPGGMKYGNALMVYHQVSPGHFPQMWVFLTDGFFRQVSPSNTFGTSYRMFRYWSSTGQACENSRAVSFTVDGVNEQNELEVRLSYTNNALCGDRFNITATAFLEPAVGSQSAMRMDVMVTNASGRAVTPSVAMHPALANQWSVLGISSMYVADNLSGGLPDWYDDMDASHRYVGSLYDGNFFNDGFSQNGQFEVSTHDIRDITFNNKTIQLSHDTGICPPISIPDYSWYGDLVAMYETSTFVRVEHAYDSAKTHELTLSACNGLISNLPDMNWVATFYRYDGNMVDGDNVQVKLSLDSAINAWPSGGVQSVSLRLTAGTTNPIVLKYPCAVRILPDVTNLTDYAEWKANDSEGYRSAEVVPLTAGVYTVTVNEVDGWVKPRQSSSVSLPASSLWGSTMQYVVFPDQPQPVSLSAVALTDAIALRWPDPNTCGYTNKAVLVRASTASYPTTLDDGREVYQGEGLSCIDTGLVSGVTVYYTLWVSDDGEAFYQPAE
ncbi:MAG: hypothetical protein PHP44_01475 [Kiritimatiellae bacterium]|nr:hypothetical protein [Kiritimatiellia bacterium]